MEEELILPARATPVYLKDVILLALHTGCRRDEILACIWKRDIDLQRRIVTIQASKGGNRKTIPTRQPKGMPTTILKA